MKILIDHALPFLLAHGGLQVQIEQTKSALERAGLEVEYLRWWDANQNGDVIHYFGRASSGYVEFAHSKGMRVVVSDLLGGLTSRPAMSRFVQRTLIAASRQFLPEMFTYRLAWDTYRIADAIIALTSYEAQLMVQMFKAIPEKVHVVPNGVESVFFQPSPGKRDKWLVCTATITPRKRVLELATAAVEAGTPLWVIGKAYGETDSYFRRFRDLCQNYPQILRYDGAIEDRKQLAQAYRDARGFVLLSSMESLSISALEAAAAECPLLLSDLPWARSTFGKQASYCPLKKQLDTTSRCLRQFYDSTPVPPPKPKTWDQIVARLRSIYEDVCKTSL
jgi:glycosyltransferase involved in cell wall biosynthesis